MGKRSLDHLRRRAIELGAKDCKVITTSTVVTAPWVRAKCQFGCSGFGRTLMCPPRSPTPDQTRKVLDSFEEALLIHCDDEPDISKIALALEREAFLSGFYKAFAMGAGPCELCSSCNTKGSCRHPYEARPSMEASGIDVFHTVRNNGFHIEVLTSPANRANYFGLVLIE